MSFQAERLIPVEIFTQTSPSQLLLFLNRWLERGLISDRQIYFKLAAKDNTAQKTINFLEVNTSVTMGDFLEGLNHWQEVGLLNGCLIRVQVEVKASNPYLIEGLEELLQLGFLSDSKVKQLCQENLSCVLPPISSSAMGTPKSQPIVVTKSSPRKSPPTIIPEKPPTSPRRTKSPSRLRQMLQSLMAELSVLWLLLLGVFMIVVSSGVIAASLWEKFPPAGQYSVLWLYTLAFWGASFWASQKPNLRLTRMALRLVTLLLVPMNFFAMDSLGLWRNPIDCLIIAIATLSLTAVTLQLFRGRYEVTHPDRFSRSLPTHLGLSYLHWGWGILGFPLWATYLGVMGTALMIVSRPPEIDREQEELRTKRLAPFSLNEAIVLYTLAILLVRAIFIAQVEITQLGLAVGICGWLATRQARAPVAVWERIGGGLMLLGWLLSVVEVPWQALAITGLGIGFFTQRLWRSWLQFDLAALLMIGLQGLWLLWRLIPASLAQGLITWGTRLTGSEDTPWALLSLALFPYLILILVLKDWFSRLGKRELAVFGGIIALMFGTTLTVLSLVNPALRTLNFAASTLTLGTFTRRQVTRANHQLSESEYISSTPLAHFTHIAGLITLISGIDWALPRLSLGIWAIILSLLMVLELAFSARQPVSLTSLLHLLGQSAWNLGLILGGLAYGLFLFNQGAVLENRNLIFHRPLIGLDWALVWGMVPFALTGMGTWNPTRRDVASWLSVVALVMWQWLTLAPLLLYWLGLEIVANSLVSSVGLAIATGLMLVNTRNLQQVAAAGITVGFGLSWIALSLWEGIFGWGLRQEASWLLAGAIASTSLWILRHRLRGISSPLGTIYGQVLDGWAIFLCSLTLFILLGNAGASPLSPLDVQTVMATWLLMGTTAYRSWQPSQEPKSVTWSSILVLLLGQIPTWGGVEIRLATLGIASGLMFVQTRRLEQLEAAAITVGLTLGLVAALLGIWPLSELAWLLAAAIAIIVLWILHQWLSQSNSETNSGQQKKLAILYARACDGWAIGLCSLELGVMVLNTGRVENPLLTLLVMLLLMGGSAYRSWQTPRSSSAIWLSITTLLVAQVPLVVLAGYNSVGLAIATGLMVVHVRYLRQYSAAIINVGFALTLVGSFLWNDWAGWALRSFDGWLLAVAVILTALWLLRTWFSLRLTQLTVLYARACDSWGIALCSLELFVLTLHSLAVYWNSIPASSLSILASALTLGAIAYRSWPSPSNWGIYGIGWSLELLTIEVLEVTEYSLIALAIANTVLGLIIQLVGDWWQRHSGRPEMLSSWNILPLLYGALGSALRWGVFSSWTGLSTLGLVLIAIGIGRRSEGLKPLLYLGIAGISISAYELLFYQIANLPTGDQLLAMAALAASFVFGYRRLSFWLTSYLRLTPAELKWIAHLHWALGSCLLLGAVFYPVEVNQPLGLGAGIFLTYYAISQGRNHPDQTIAEIWVYLGILEAVAMGVYIGSLINHQGLFIRYLAPWLGAIAFLVAASCYLLPWQTWGWPPRPWQVVALVLPLMGIGGYVENVNEVSLLAVAFFYFGLARMRQQPRWCYLTLLLVNWTIVRWLEWLQIAIPFSYSSLVGLSLISVSWIEPACRRTEGKPLRHYLRLLGTGIICGAALWLHHQTGILPGIISLVAIFAGLALRIRAFLYIGTLTFLVDAFYQLVILIFEYPLLKWIVGLLVGLSLLSIAGSFETRRTQLTVMVQNWLAKLQTWE